MIRIRVRKAPGKTVGNALPKMGDQQGHSLYVADAYDHQPTQQSVSTNQVLSPVDPAYANIEAEKNETVVGDFDQDGMNEHFTVGGSRHSRGGTPLHVPDGSFVFSDTRGLKIGGPILQEFGKGKNTLKKFTPAALAKQYPINSYKTQLDNPDADHLDKTTASLMIRNNQKKLATLALVQEAMKSFPNGVPGVSVPLFQSGPNPVMWEGGPVLPVNPYKGDKQVPRKFQRERLGLKKGFNQYNTPWLQEYGFSNTPQGLDEALLTAGYPGDLKNSKAIQQFLIKENLRRNNQNVFRDLHRRYGMTNQGLAQGLTEEQDLPMDQQGLEKIYADGKFGVRSGLLLQPLLDKSYKPSTFKVPLATFDRTSPEVKTKFPDRINKENQPPVIDWKKREEETMPWWTQDTINFGASLRNRYNIRSYTPTYNGIQAVLPTPTFMDPTRSITALQEQAAGQGYQQTLLANPSQARASQSQLQGQAGAQLANLISQVQPFNVNTSNEFEGKSTDITNNAALRNTMSRKQYQDEWTIGRQQYDNSVREAGDAVRANLVGGMSNAQRTSWLNQLTPQFRIDPSSGRMHFMEGKTVGAVTAEGPVGGNDSTSTIDAYDKFYQEAKAKGYSEDKAHDWAGKMIFGNRSRFSVDSDGDSRMMSSSFGTNPMALQLLGAYAPQYLSR